MSFIVMATPFPKRAAPINASATALSSSGTAVSSSLSCVTTAYSSTSSFATSKSKFQGALFLQRRNNGKSGDGEMEVMAMFTGSNICVTSSSLLSTTNSNATTRITSQLHTSATHLSAFPSKSHLFSSSSTSSYARTIRTRSTTESGIFLPHLIASLEQVDQTYIMVKPDGVQRGLVGEIISRFEKKGFKLTGLKLFQCSKELAEEHYKDRKQKSLFPAMIDYITSGPVVSMAWEGVGVVASARKLIGATYPLQAEPGTIRGDLAVQRGRNIIRGSDSPENGERETALWFKEGELCEWTPVQQPWLTEQ